MEDKEYIKRFSKITVSKICRKLNYPINNVLAGTASKERLSEVKKELESELAKLYIKE